METEELAREIAAVLQGCFGSLYHCGYQSRDSCDEDRQVSIELQIERNEAKQCAQDARRAQELITARREKDATTQGSTSEGPGTDSKAISDDLSGIPPFDRASGRWVSSRQANDGVQTETLGNHRCEGRKNPDGLSGIDIHGRVWRKQSKYAHVWYLRASLLKNRS